DHVQPKIYNDTLLKRDLLPLPLTEVTESPPGQPITFERNTFGSPFFYKFRTDENYDGFNKVEGFKTVGIEDPSVAGGAKKDGKDAKPASGSAEDPTTILLRYSNGKPAMASKKVGNGEVMFVGTAMHPVWTNTGQIGWTDLPLRHGL